MKNMLQRRVVTALVLALTASCASTRLGADGVVKARLGSLRRDDMVVVDVKGGGGGALDTNAVREVVAEYDRTVIQPREGSGGAGTDVATRLDRLELVDDELALKTDRIYDLVDTNTTVMAGQINDLVLYATNNFIAASNANARAWNLEKWRYDVGRVLGFWFDNMFLDTNTVFAVYAGDIGLRPRQAISVMDDARVFLYGVAGYGGLDPTNGVRDLAAVVNGKADRSEIPKTAADIGALPDTYEPPAQANADWAAASGVARILNKPDLAAVATSGSYNDLKDKPEFTTSNTELVDTIGTLAQGKLTSAQISAIDSAVHDRQTVVTYTNGETATFDIAGELTSSSITNINNVSNVVIGSGVTSIGGGAFEVCRGLKSVTIPDSVTDIGDAAFSYCIGLTNVTIPNSVTNIGADSFADCTGLKSVTIGDSVKSIKNGAFYNCTNVTDVVVPGWQCEIPFAAVTNLVISDSVTSIGDNVFSYCSGLTSVTIGNGVTTIGDVAFAVCTNLTSVTIPDSVTSIGWGAFYGCRGLTSVTIPNSVTSIGEEAFWNCISLTNITFIGKSPKEVREMAEYSSWGIPDLIITTWHDASKEWVEQQRFANAADLRYRIAEARYATTGARLPDGASIWHNGDNVTESGILSFDAGYWIFGTDESLVSWDEAGSFEGADSVILKVDGTTVDSFNLTVPRTIADRTVNLITATNEASIYIDLPSAVTVDGVRYCRDFILDVDNTANGDDLALEFTGLGTAYALVVDDGVDIAEVTAVAAGKLCRLRFRETAFVTGGSVPVLHVSRVTCSPPITQVVRSESARLRAAGYIVVGRATMSPPTTFPTLVQ